MDKIERTKKIYYDVLPAYNIDTALTYSSNQIFKVGSLVKISIRKKIFAGCILNIYQHKPEINFKVKDIEESQNYFYLDKKKIDFLKWVSEYNFISFGLALKLMISNVKFLEPNVAYKYIVRRNLDINLTNKQKIFIKEVKGASFEEQKNILSNYSKSFINNIIDKNIIEKKVYKEKKNIRPDLQKVKLKKLSLQQDVVYNKILEKINKKKYKPIFLDGVTGSGKTEVYFKLIKHFLANKKQVLVLIPEIALSKQWISRFYNAFKFYPLVWNSKVNQSEKKKIWQDIIQGKINVVVGARSAIFLPFSKLGITIIDEENDISYKQEENPIYNARDMAVVKSKINLSDIVLVSATPSLETYNNSKNKKYDYYKLTDRFGSAKNPKVFLIDMKLDKKRLISKHTIALLKEKINKGKQILILINKRGYAPITICSNCGHRETCKKCDINLVYHKKNNKLICHHCGYSMDPKSLCINCGEPDKKIRLGYGIEKVTEEIKIAFNNINIISLSSDSIDYSTFQKVLEDIENANTKIIIGTQIISKGFNFLNLSSIFILDFDLWFYNTDIRTNEKIFQLIHQVSGRTSRKSETGEVFIQTYDTNNSLLKYIVSGNRDKFYESELFLRKKTLLPPYCKLIAIILIGNDKNYLRTVSFTLKDRLSNFNDFTLLGPIPAPVEYIKNEYRYRMLIKTNHAFRVQKIFKIINFSKILKNKAKIKIDIDPLSFF